MFKNFMNKRVSRRKECDYQLKYSIMEGEQESVFGAEIKDVSMNGFAIESKDVIKVGSTIQGELPFPFLEQPIKFVGKVMRSQSAGQDRYIYGISFDQIDTSSQERIGEYVEKVDLSVLLSRAVKKGATSVHLAVGCVPVCRVDGKVMHIDVVPVSHGDMEKMVFPVISAKQKEELYSNLELDFAYTLPQEKRRFRMNVFFDKGNLAVVAKIIGSEIRSFDDLGLPPVLKDVVNKKSGLIIVSGPVDSGKSTTLAAIIESINRKRESVIISIEDPIEYIYESKNSFICQRDVGLDTLSFSGALRSALRQDVDIVLMGEIRDLDSVSQAVTAAEEGHLVFSTLHTTSVVDCINRLIDIFPIEQQMQMRIQIATCLEGVVCQYLLPRADGKGRVLATEVLVPTPAIRNLIRKARTEQIYSYLESGAEFGMHTMDSSLMDLFRRGLITKDTAAAFVTKKEVFGLR
ncbi:MAG: PilT/PilU family type 4a pilus ATPase [Candidatus Omnitrophica bacterium]|nr:PilT/PilU family type 4a pilus ATPase [Candidatus Omnitrophota bacterium]